MLEERLEVVDQSDRPKSAWRVYNVRLSDLEHVCICGCTGHGSKNRHLLLFCIDVEAFRLRTFESIANFLQAHVISITTFIFTHLFEPLYLEPQT